MLDTHTHPENWGVYPYLFDIGGFHLPTYSVFVIIGLIVGSLVFFRLSRQQGRNYDNTVLILMGALVFGIIGSKLPILIGNIPKIIEDPTNIMLYLSGRTVVGGLIGGTIGVLLVKRIFNIKERRGNMIAPAAAIGIAFGRIGCYLRGCCYGIATNVGLGTDFGDGVLRHPTQLYEATFHFLAFFIMMYQYKRVQKPGVLFKYYVIAYFIYRFLSEFIRVEPDVISIFSGYQIASLVGIILLILKEMYYGKKKRESDLQIQEGS